MRGGAEWTHLLQVVDLSLLLRHAALTLAKQPLGGVRIIGGPHQLLPDSQPVCPAMQGVARGGVACQQCRMGVAYRAVVRTLPQLVKLTLSALVLLLHLPNTSLLHPEHEKDSCRSTNKD